MPDAQRRRLGRNAEGKPGLPHSRCATAQKEQLPGRGASIRLPAPAGMIWNATNSRSTVPTRWTWPPPGSTKPCPAGTTCGVLLSWQMHLGPLLRTRREGVRVLDRLEGSAGPRVGERRRLRIDVGLDRTCLRVGDHHDDVHVGQSACKRPVARIEVAAIQDFDTPRSRRRTNRKAAARKKGKSGDCS